MIIHCCNALIATVNLQCTDDDNRSYRNVCNMSFVSFSLAAIFIIHRTPKLRNLNRACLNSTISFETGDSCCVPPFPLIATSQGCQIYFLPSSLCV